MAVNEKNFEKGLLNIVMVKKAKYFIKELNTSNCFVLWLIKTYYCIESVSTSSLGVGVVCISYIKLMMVGIQAIGILINN